MGDVIHFARYLPIILEAGGCPVLICAPALVPLMRSMPGVEAVAAAGPLPAYDAWADQMSLPNLMGTTLETIPAATGYLAADPERVQAWRARLPAGRKVGVVFAGSPLHQRDRCRSVPLDVALPVAVDYRRKLCQPAAWPVRRPAGSARSVEVDDGLCGNGGR